MIKFFKKLFGGNVETSGSRAKERLQIVLIHDRVGLSPDLLETLREDLLQVVSKYVEIDNASVEVDLKERDRSIALTTSIPIKGRKKSDSDKNKANGK